MKIKFSDGVQEVTVTARGLWGDRTNKKDTIAFLNELSLVYGYAAKYEDMSGHAAMARGFREKANDIFQMLKEIGAYDEE